MKNMAIAIGLVLLLGASLAFGLRLDPSAQAATPVPTGPAPAPTESAPLNTVKAIGTFVSADQVSLAFQLGGRVTEIPVKEGDKVSQSALLASVDTTSLNLQVTQAQAALDAAQANFDKVKAGPTVDDITIAKTNVDNTKAALSQAQTAYDRAGGASNPFIGLLPQSLALQQATSAYRAAVAAYNEAVNHPTAAELQSAQAQLVQAQTALALAKQNLANAQIVAPFDGTVLSIDVEVGETATPGVPVLAFADLSHMQVQVNVDENALSLIKVGETAAITSDALPGQTFTGRVSKIGWLATSTSGIVNVPVTIDVQNSNTLIDPGLSATAVIDVGN